MATRLATRPVEVALQRTLLTLTFQLRDTAALLRITTFPPESFPVTYFGAPREWLAIPTQWQGVRVLRPIESDS